MTNDRMEERNGKEKNARREPCCRSGGAVPPRKGGRWNARPAAHQDEGNKGGLSEGVKHHAQRVSF
jgi:hypothetical protein